MLDPLGDQGLALTADPPTILLLRGRRLDHRADPRLAAFEGQQRANQGLAVNLVGFRPPPPSRNQDRGSVDHMALNSLTLKHAMDPKAVQPSLLNDDDREALSSPLARLFRDLLEEPQKLRDVPADHDVLRHLLSAAWRQRGDQPCRSGQLHRYKDRAKINANSELL